MNPTTPDPIDDLIPRGRPWWVRLSVAVVVVGLVGVSSFLWGQGYFRPSPDCCGSGGGSTMMALSLDGKAVTVTAYLYNSSGRALQVDSATADLPGATVRDIRMLSADDVLLEATGASTLPADLAGHTGRRLAVTFTPDTCVDEAGSWGHIMVHLEVLNGWLPSVGRDYMLPDAVVEPGQSNLLVWPPDDSFDSTRFTTPLAAACALLGRGT